MLPISVLNKIQTLLAQGDEKSSVVLARHHLTERYRSLQGTKKSGGFKSSSEIHAYIATRLPATFAAVMAVLPNIPLHHIFSVLDLGAGPGTATLAAALHWPECQKFHLVEKDDFMREISQHLLKDMPELHSKSVSFQLADLLKVTVEESYDLVFLSYVLNEFYSAGIWQEILKKAWEKTLQGLVVVMPGTPSDYQHLMKVRDRLIEWGAFIAAPCPHHKVCPLQGEDWCHFSTRLMRSSLHQEIKEASLPYEDEKYSYLVAMRNPTERPLGRVVRFPLQRSGHMVLDLCTSEGLKRQTVSKRTKDKYKAAKKISWGDSWEDFEA